VVRGGANNVSSHVVVTSVENYSSATSVIRLSMHIVVVGRGVVGTAEVCSLTLGLLMFVCLSGMSVGSTVCGWFSPFRGKISLCGKLGSVRIQSSIGLVSAARSACFGSNSVVRFSVVQG